MLPRKETVMRTRGERRQLSRSHQRRTQQVRKIKEHRQEKAEHDNPVRDERVDWDIFEWADLAEEWGHE